MEFDETGVMTVEGKELVVGATFDDASVVQDADEVGVPDSAESMRDDECGAVTHKVLQGLLNELFGLGVECGCGFVEDKQGRVLEDSACDGYTLPLSAGES